MSTTAALIYFGSLALTILVAVIVANWITAKAATTQYDITTAQGRTFKNCDHVRIDHGQVWFRHNGRFHVCTFEKIEHSEGVRHD